VRTERRVLLSTAQHSYRTCFKHTAMDNPTVAALAGLAAGAAVATMYATASAQRAESADKAAHPNAAASSSTMAGHVAVVTGSGGGIGRSIAEKFAAAGASVMVADFNAAAGEATVAKIYAAGGEATFCLWDATKEADTVRLMATTKATYGRLDHLVNNAVRFVFGHLRGAGAGSGTGTDRDVTDEDWKALFETNVLGYARTIKHALPLMRLNQPSDKIIHNDQGAGVARLDCGSRGSIVNVASVSSWIAQPEFIPYNISKGGVSQMTKCCALDFADERIRVNAVGPGTIDTQGAYGHMKAIGTNDGVSLVDNDYAEGKKFFGTFASCAKRMAAPDEVASAVFFLASDEASYITGELLVVDGGLSI